MHLVRGWSHALAGLAATLLVLAPLSGCSDASMDASVKKLFASKPSPQQSMLTAISDSDADVRREAVANVASSNEADTEWAVKGFAMMALLERDPQARCIAIRALADTGDASAAETLLKVLNYREFKPTTVRPPDDAARWDATDGVATLLERGQVPEDQLDTCRETLLRLLRGDSDRHVRLCAARGLGSFVCEPSVRGLIGGLRDDDFAVVHACEDSLVRITGVTHDCQAREWEEWLAAHEQDMLAHAGELPPSREPPYRNRWQKMSYNTREFFRWIFPTQR